MPGGGKHFSSSELGQGENVLSRAGGGLRCAWWCRTGGFAPVRGGEVLLETGWGWNPSHENPHDVP